MRHTRNRNMAIALLTVLGCSLWLYLRLSKPQTLWEGYNLLLALGILAGTGWIGMEKLRHDTNLEELLTVLYKKPDSLVWVYYLNVKIQPFGVHVRQITTLYFWLDNSRHLSLRASEKDCIGLMNELRLLLPHACFGYSLQKEQLYRADPSLLKQ